MPQKRFFLACSFIADSLSAHAQVAGDNVESETTEAAAAPLPEEPLWLPDAEILAIMKVTHCSCFSVCPTACHPVYQSVDQSFNCLSACHLSVYHLCIH